jgi:hypothetical protein
MVERHFLFRERQPLSFSGYNVRATHFLFQLQGKGNLSFPGYKVRARFPFRLQGKGHPFLFWLQGEDKLSFLFRLQGKRNISFFGYKVRLTLNFSGYYVRATPFLFQLLGNGNLFFYDYTGRYRDFLFLQRYLFFCKKAISFGTIFFHRRKRAKRKPYLSKMYLKVVQPQQH